MGLDELSIDPCVLDHQLQHAREERCVTPRSHGEVQVTGARDGRDARVLDDHLRPALSRLPDVVGGDRGALGDIGTGDPDHFGSDHVRPWAGGAIDAERLLVGGARAHHAEATVVIDERRLQADARELAEQIGLLGREARSAQHRDRAVAVCLLEARDFAGCTRDRVLVAQGPKAARARRVALQCREQSIRMRALQVALDALGTEHAAIERELVPRLEADDVVTTDLELYAALLTAKAAVGLDQLFRLVARGAADGRREMRPIGLDD